MQRYSSIGSHLIPIILTMFASSISAEELSLSLRFRQESSPDSGRYHTLERIEEWDAEETAIIVCDVWDSHHCLNAVRRVTQLAPRLDRVLSSARSRGVTIIHAPSDCMDAYADHPARKRAVDAPQAADMPAQIDLWCSSIPSEERGEYPIDQSDGGEDDDPVEHAAWVANLKSQGRNPGTPWKSQSSLITIDESKDYVSDRGSEVWNVLEMRGIENVILVGVHTNMCVLGRPFGLRQMSKNGKNVVLMRDMTDTMYNPKRWPYVSHFTGTDLIVSHIERHVCPTITSDQLIGGTPFRFRHDKRPHLVIVMAEDEYETEKTLPEFANRKLGQEFRVSFVFGSDTVRNQIPGLEELASADLALFSIRRRVLTPAQMDHVRKYVNSGKPVIGIRTASHAFSLRGKTPPEGFVAWADFDAQVFGGNYTNHHGNKLKSTVQRLAGLEHPILTGIAGEAWPQGGSLYVTSPLDTAATTLIDGEVQGQPREPVAWTFVRADGGKSFYTSMGHPDDFKSDSFIRLLVNALHWAVDIDLPSTEELSSNDPRIQQNWSLLQVPGSWRKQTPGHVSDLSQIAWYRCVVRLPGRWIESGTLEMEAAVHESDALRVWANGVELKSKKSRADQFSVPRDSIMTNDANLIVARIHSRSEAGGFSSAPVLKCGSQRLALKGRWQFRIGDNPDWSNMPLPAKFGTPTDILFSP